MIVVIITALVMIMPLQKSPKWWNLRNQMTLLLLINLQGNKKRQLQPFHFSATQRTNGAQRHHRGATAALLSGNESSSCEADTGSCRTTFPLQEARVSRTAAGWFVVDSGWCGGWEWSRRPRWGESRALNSSYSGGDLQWERGNSQPHFEHHGCSDDWWG